MTKQHVLAVHSEICISHSKTAAMDDSSETSDGFGATSLVPARVRSLLVPTPKARCSESSKMNNHDWNTVVMNAFASSHNVRSTLSYPWERGAVSGVFSDRLLPALQSAAPSIGYDLSTEVVDPFAMSVDQSHVRSMEGLHFTAFVKNIPDQEYFEAKQARMDLACSRWLVLLQQCSLASTAGIQLLRDMYHDNTGVSAEKTLRALFGTKSPNTVLKRARTMTRYCKWVKDDLREQPLPIQEWHVWSFINHLEKNSFGSTSGTDLVECLRFCKYIFGMHGVDEVLQSRRILGLAAIMRSAKKVKSRAPPLTLEQVHRLHEILSKDTIIENRVMAGTCLFAIYSRARWSDLRCVDHMILNTKNGEGTLEAFTREHKMSALGLRREQFLPLIAPAQGVCHGDWTNDFRVAYEQAGLNMFEKPLGPLMRAPDGRGGWYKRALTTEEAANWLRSFVQGLNPEVRIRSHSLKCTACIWAAREGFDKETRAALSHHCSAVAGSEVVYSRELQVRPIRKLQMLFKKIRLGLESALVVDNGISTEDELVNVGQSSLDLNMGVEPPASPLYSPSIGPAMDIQPGAVKVECPDILEVNSSGEEVACPEPFEFLGTNSEVDEAIHKEFLFSPAVVETGKVSLDSSSGSDSSSSTTSESSDQDRAIELEKHTRTAFQEVVAEGLEYYKHLKSKMLHSAKEGSAVFSCKRALSDKYVKMPRVIKFKYPHCLGCFKKDDLRIRDVGKMADMLTESARKRSLQFTESAPKLPRTND